MWEFNSCLHCSVMNTETNSTATMRILPVLAEMTDLSCSSSIIQIHAANMAHKVTLSNLWVKKECMFV